MARVRFDGRLKKIRPSSRPQDFIPYVYYKKPNQLKVKEYYSMTRRGVVRRGEARCGLVWIIKEGERTG